MAAEAAKASEASAAAPRAAPPEYAGGVEALFSKLEARYPTFPKKL